MGADKTWADMEANPTRNLRVGFSRFFDRADAVLAYVPRDTPASEMRRFVEAELLAITAGDQSNICELVACIAVFVHGRGKP